MASMAEIRTYYERSHDWHGRGAQLELHRSEIEFYGRRIAHSRTGENGFQSEREVGS